MEQQDKTSASAGPKAADFIAILFRWKWVVLGCSLAGAIVCVFFYYLVPATYKSEAKLFIRYVLEKAAPTEAGTPAEIRRPDASGNNIINSEVQVISSFDLALQVADVLGPAKILGPDAAGALSRHQAAEVISKGLNIEVPPRSDVVRISFYHNNSAIVQPVLSALIAGYLKKHDEIHRASGLFDELLTQQTDALRSQLSQTEDDLRKLTLKAGVPSIDDAKRAFSEERSRIRLEMNDTQAAMAEIKAAMAARGAVVPAGTNDAQVTATVPPEKTNEYRSLLSRLDTLRRREQELIRQFTPENFLVQTIQEQIAAAAKSQAALETEYPELVTTTRQLVAPQQSTSSVPDPAQEPARLAALQAKLAAFEAQLERVTREINSLNEIEPEITRLQRKKELEETQYRHFLTSLEQARFDEALGSGRLSNIGVAQSPSPPVRESRKMMKTLGMIMAFSIGLGLVIAFGWELYLHPVVRSTADLKRFFGGPVFISIPKMRKKDAAPARALLKAGENGSASQAKEVVQWTPADKFQVYYEGLRDRLMTWFEVQKLTRKPKLVAVTSCNNGAGVSSIAAGLAATLSETGDGRVLLVDMNVGEGAAHSFYRGKPGCGIDDALEAEKRDDAQVHENLFVVAEGRSHHERLPSVLPRRFTSLVPRLKASDFDYIIFDMPPVAPTTITPRLSAYMDMTLLVVESQKTSSESLKQASQLLSDARANVGTVMNKSVSHVPKWLGQGGQDSV